MSKFGYRNCVSNVTNIFMEITTAFRADKTRSTFRSPFSIGMTSYGDGSVNRYLNRVGY